MAEVLRSVGLDVGTTSTQMILSELTIENKASAFSVPEMCIAQRRILYKSPIHFTPLLSRELVDGEGIRHILTEEYRKAGILREDVDTGAIIITGETSRKENAAAVLQNISDLAGDFVVATAGPDLESILAARGAGATDYSEESGKRVLHMDIGGGTSNLALIENGRIIATGCLNIGGRLVKMNSKGEIQYISPVLDGIFSAEVGSAPTRQTWVALANTLVSVLEMAAGLREKTPLLNKFWTAEAGTPWVPPPANTVISFSGGVADCIQHTHPDLAFGDLGPILGQAIRQSLLCAGNFRLGSETIRATVIGAGCHAAQLSGSTVFYRNVLFPIKNLPVVTNIADLATLDGPGALALAGSPGAHYEQIRHLADEIAAKWPDTPVYVVLEADMAKALGHALALRLPEHKPILCIDRVHLSPGSYLDVGAPIATALPVVVKTLILNR